MQAIIEALEELERQEAALRVARNMFKPVYSAMSAAGWDDENIDPHTFSLGRQIKAAEGVSECLVGLARADLTAITRQVLPGESRAEKPS